MQIKVAKHAGTCFGVSNAINLAFAGAKKTKDRTYILGDLVHNPEVVAQLLELGVKTIQKYTQLKTGDSLIIRAHGEPEEVYEYCNKHDITLIDCTCQYVRSVQRLARKLKDMDYKVILVGDKEHPEVRGITGKAKDATVISNAQEIDVELLRHKKLGIISQTTQSAENFNKIVSKLNAPGKLLKVHNTICNATAIRQKNALELCNKVDKMIVIGGKNSANTKRLFELCSEKVKTYWITSEVELVPDWFGKDDTIGITAGASTPIKTIENVNLILSGGKLFK